MPVHKVAAEAFPFSIDVYDYVDGTPLTHIDVDHAGAVSVPGYRRPVVVAITYWTLRQTQVMGPPQGPEDPESEPGQWIWEW